jgi:predicted ATP-grasp superfamily ATP-dependent carboligase
MIPQNLFIFEFVSGGGYNKVNIPSSLFCEGFAMLRTTVEDFKKLGFKITILLDERIHHLSRYLNSDEVKFVKKKEDFLTKYIDCVKDSTHCFIIAPEFSNHLFNLTRIVKEHNKGLLSIDIEGILLGASKYETYQFFKQYKVNTPKTYKIPLKDNMIDLEFILQKFHQLGSSIIIKPDDGAGSELVFHFETKDQILQFFKIYREKLEVGRSYLVQEYIEGDELSVSIINIPNPKQLGVIDSIILSINNQKVTSLGPNKEFLYLGGSTPVKNYDVIRDGLEEILNSLDLTYFKGYFGIDFIRKNDNSICLIEINPRLTTSYIGIRNVLDYNPFTFLFALHKFEPVLTRFKPKKFSHFTRLELKYSGNKLIENLIKNIIPKIMDLVPEMMTPPFTLKNSKIYDELTFSCFISTKEKNEKISDMRLAQIITIFNDHNFSVLNR